MSKRYPRCTGLIVAAVVAAASGTLAQEPSRGATRVSPGGTTRVFVMAGFDSQCRSTPSAQITVDVPPAKGSVSMREGQGTTVQYSLSGSCIGAKVQGVGIYYSARPNTEGADTFSISARLASGETASRTFHLNISE
jgi:hypothetical protein